MMSRIILAKLEQVRKMTQCRDPHALQYPVAFLYFQKPNKGPYTTSGQVSLVGLKAFILPGFADVS